MAGNHIVKVSDTDFKNEVLDITSEPVVVDFFAEWCGPCKAMAPALDEVARDMAGKVRIAKIDVDQNPEITARYQIQAMPTLILFKNGEEAARHTGALVQKTKLEAWINEAI